MSRVTSNRAAVRFTRSSASSGVIIAGQMPRNGGSWCAMVRLQRAWLRTSAQRMRSPGPPLVSNDPGRTIPVLDERALDQAGVTVLIDDQVVVTIVVPVAHV